MSTIKNAVKTALSRYFRLPVACIKPDNEDIAFYKSVVFLFFDKVFNGEIRNKIT
ncbi:hypothetical protein KsCSTR_33550 [Candidatus Kuenenia stuttgartiensis]|uniref:Uncharacterized protein n=1 Tax=Kuenenia stuttgartiensis TaxID=174633 RepID=Q1Q4F1_KUEST|nr:hypothetical protein KsCSTR_33550 [Candidatus Kuenenia stuttgartiensis]CAJ74882.1 unknown protein [Candidatus Kuenenia stuttgartiensis]